MHEHRFLTSHKYSEVRQLLNLCRNVVGGAHPLGGRVATRGRRGKVENIFLLRRLEKPPTNEKHSGRKRSFENFE